jgi:drug/metabolite transporter (DMT)-like permease
MLGQMEALERPVIPILAMLAAIAFWGGSFIATKAAVAEVPPVAFALVRFGLATVVMLAAQAATRTPLRVPQPLWGPVVWVALLGTTATYVLENIALKYTTSGNGSLLIAVSPMLTAVGAVAFLGERLTWRMAAGALLAAIGVVLLVSADLGHTGVGDAIMVVTTLVGIAYNLLSKRLADAMPALTALTVTFAVGFLGIIPCAVAEALWFPGPWHPTGTTLAALLYLGLGSSCVACWLWMYALGRMPASRVTLFLYLMPVFTLVGGHFVLGEHLGLDTALEAGLILVGVYVASTR